MHPQPLAPLDMASVPHVHDTKLGRGVLSIGAGFPPNSTKVDGIDSPLIILQAKRGLLRPLHEFPPSRVTSAPGKFASTRVASVSVLLRDRPVGKRLSGTTGNR